MRDLIRIICALSSNPADIFISYYLIKYTQISHHPPRNCAISYLISKSLMVLVRNLSGRPAIWWECLSWLYRPHYSTGIYFIDIERKKGKVVYGETCTRNVKNGRDVTKHFCRRANYSIRSLSWETLLISVLKKKWLK